MVIGVDFDNTIVNYDSVFHAVALERGLIPSSLPATKQHVRDYLRGVDQEPAWTELQGDVYGPKMRLAGAFTGVLDFFHTCRKMDIRVAIISHKTQFPFLGPRHDLHQAAQDWLSFMGFYDAARGGLVLDQVYFELTKEAKLSRIGHLGCTHFIDDLPEFLSERGFPPNVERILFDPNNSASAVSAPLTRASSWTELAATLLA